MCLMSMDVPVCNGMVAESRIEIPIRDVTDVCVCVFQGQRAGWRAASRWCMWHASLECRRLCTLKRRMQLMAQLAASL